MRRTALLLLPLLALAGWLLWSVLVRAADVTPPRVAGDTDAVVDGAGVTESPRRRRVQAPVEEPAAEDANAVSAPSEPPEKIILRVLVEGSDAPLAGLTVREDTGRERAVVTDGEGRAVFAMSTATERNVVSASAPGIDRLELGVGETVVRVPPPIPIAVRFVDQETGHPMPGGGVEVACGGAEERSIGPDGTVRLRHPAWPGRSVTVAVRTRVTVRGYSLPGRGSLERDVRISRYAEGVLATVAVPREAALRAVVRDSAGRPVADAVASTWSAGVHAQATTDAGGEAVLTGIPFHRGERLVISAVCEGREASGETPPLASPDAESVVVLHLPDEPSPIGIGGGSGRAFSSRSSSRRLTPRTGTSSLVVQVLRRDGRPAFGARVGLAGPTRRGRTVDDDGFARFDELAAGTYRVRCTEHGLAAMEIDVELGDGESGRAVLREPEGRSLLLRTVDAQGRALPGVRLRISDATDHPWVHIDRDGVQHADVFSGGAGDVRLSHVPRGPLQIEASYGSRSLRVVLRDGDPNVVTIPDPPVSER